MAVLYLTKKYVLPLVPALLLRTLYYTCIFYLSLYFFIMTLFYNNPDIYIKCFVLERK
jgi:hypothetical protein